MHTSLKKSVYLAFMPHQAKDAGTTTAICLVNRTPYVLDALLTLNREGGDASYEARVPAGEAKQVGMLPFADCDKLSQARLQLTLGAPLDKTFERSLRITPHKLFSRSPAAVHGLEAPAFCMDCLAGISLSHHKAQPEKTDEPEQADPETQPVDPEILKRLPEQWLSRTPDPTNRPLPDAPPQEVDLHIEKLVADPAERSKLDNAEMLQLQLNHFEKCLEAAITHNYYFITFIHGLGKGTLKREILKRLGNYSEVKDIDSYYDKRYGFGATKVILRT